jgi:hypothetical protein
MGMTVMTYLKRAIKKHTLLKKKRQSQIASKTKGGGRTDEAYILTGLLALHTILRST